jgi:hypothetical protein
LIDEKRARRNGAVGLISGQIGRADRPHTIRAERIKPGAARRTLTGAGFLVLR